MPEQRMLYVHVEYRDREGVHSRGSTIAASSDDRVVRELVYRGIVSDRPVRREAGQNSSRVTGGPAA